MKTYVYVDGFNLYYAIKNSGAKWLNLKTLAEQVVPSAVVKKVRYFTARVSGATDPGAPGRQQVYYNALSTVPEVEMHFGNFLAKGAWRPVMLLPASSRPITDSNGTTSTLADGVATVGLDSTLPASHMECLPVGQYGGRDGNAKPVALPNAIKARVFTMEEKGSDVNLAVHLVNDAWACGFDAAIVISNDTDLVEPIRIVAQQLGKPVYLLTPPGRYGAASPLVKVATHQRHIRQAHLNASQFPDPLSDSNGAAITKPAGW
jgi:hypothetical protein